MWYPLFLWTDWWARVNGNFLTLIMCYHWITIKKNSWLIDEECSSLRAQHGTAIRDFHFHYQTLPLPSLPLITVFSHNHLQCTEKIVAIWWDTSRNTFLLPNLWIIFPLTVRRYRASEYSPLNSKFCSLFGFSICLIVYGCDSKRAKWLF